MNPLQQALTQSNIKTLAIPSKGRMHGQCLEFFKTHGLTITRPGGERDYTGQIAELPEIAVQFMSASQIAEGLRAQTVDAGVTGRDLVHETPVPAHNRPKEVLELDFGHADVVLALPKAWIDVETMRDVAELSNEMFLNNNTLFRIATKYEHITRRFCECHGMKHYNIIESAGATEAAPNAGLAEAIVDITSTGSTLKANGLKVIEDGVMLKSQACLYITKLI